MLHSAVRISSMFDNVLRREHQFTGTWAEFVGWVGPHVAGPKNGPAIVPYAPEWADGESEQPRAAAQLRPGARWSILTLDLDEATDDEIEAAVAQLGMAGVNFLVHSTYSYDPAERMKCRVHVPMTRALTHAEVPVARERLAAWLSVAVDKATRGGHTLFYTPRCPDSLLSEAFLVSVTNGHDVDPDTLPPAPARAKAAPAALVPAAVRPMAEWPDEVREAARGHLAYVVESIKSNWTPHMRAFIVGHVSLVAGYCASGLLDTDDTLETIEQAVHERARVYGGDDRSAEERMVQIESLVGWGGAKPIVPKGFDPQTGLPTGRRLRVGRGGIQDQLAEQAPPLLMSIPEAQQRLHAFLRQPRDPYNRWIGVVDVSVGGGKAQPNSEPVLLDRGWTPIGDVRPGDRIYGSDGCLHDVLGVFPQGVRDVWEVEFSDGAVVRCDADHLWTFTSPQGRYPKTRTASEWASLSLKKKHAGNAYFCPMAAPISRPDAELPIDPYSLGLLVGDGSLSGSGVQYTSMDEELVGHLRKTFRLTATKTQNSGRATHYAVVGKKDGRESLLIRALRDLGLMFTTSHTKFIPAEYKNGSVAQRLAFLQGLMDTDGSWGRSRVDYGTASKELAHDVKELVESLGGRARLGTRITSCTHKGVKNLFESYRVRFKLPRDMCPFRLTRKVDLWKTAAHQSGPTRGVVRITRTSEQEEATCIQVSAPDSLYVTKHHVLTHNTHHLRQLAAERATRGEYTVILSLDHGLLGQIRRDLEEAGVAVRHLASVIQPTERTGAVACERREEPLVQLLVRSGANTSASVCPKCHHRSGCPALAHSRRALDAYVVLAPYTMAEAALGRIAERSDSPGAPLLVCDEEPPPPETLLVSDEELSDVLQNDEVWGLVREDHAATVKELAFALVNGWDVAQELIDHVQQFRGQLHMAPGVSIPALIKNRQDLNTVRILTQCALGWATRVRMPDHWRIEVPSTVWAVLKEEGGFVLSATPNADMYEGTPTRELQLRLKDHTTTVREVWNTPHARRSMVMPEGVINWDLVGYDLQQVLGAMPPNAKVILGSYKAIVDQLHTTKRELLLGMDVDLIHYEVVRGRDDWRGCTHFVSLYDPLPPPPMDVVASVTGSNIYVPRWEASTAAAARTLTQFHGRARDPQPRDVGAIHWHIGTVPPVDWFDGNSKVVDRPAPPAVLSGHAKSIEQASGNVLRLVLPSNGDRPNPSGHQGGAPLGGHLRVAGASPAGHQRTRA